VALLLALLLFLLTLLATLALLTTLLALARALLLVALALLATLLRVAHRLVGHSLLLTWGRRGPDVVGWKIPMFGGESGQQTHSPYCGIATFAGTHGRSGGGDHGSLQ